MGGLVVVVVVLGAAAGHDPGLAGLGDGQTLLLVGGEFLGVGGTLLISDGLARLIGNRCGLRTIRTQLHLDHPDGLLGLRIAAVLARMRRTRGSGAHLWWDRPLQDPNLHGVLEIGTWIEHRRGVTGVPQRRRDGIPPEPDQMHTDSGIHRHADPGDHIGVPRHQDHVRTMPPVGRLDHVRHQQRVHSLLSTAVTPLDQLTGAQLHTLDDAESPLIPVRARIGDAVIPVLALDRLIHQTVGDLI